MTEEVKDGNVQASEEIIEGKFHDQFIVDPIQGGAGTSTNMNANEVIANRALEILGEAKGNYDIVHPNIHVNMSQSTNDAVPTAVHVALLHSIDRLVVILEKLVASINDKAVEFDSV